VRERPTCWVTCRSRGASPARALPCRLPVEQDVALVISSPVDLRIVAVGLHSRRARPGRRSLRGPLETKDGLPPAAPAPDSRFTTSRNLERCRLPGRRQAPRGGGVQLVTEASPHAGAPRSMGLGGSVSAARRPLRSPGRPPRTWSPADLLVVGLHDVQEGGHYGAPVMPTGGPARSAPPCVFSFSIGMLHSVHDRDRPGSANASFQLDGVDGRRSSGPSA